MFFIIPQRPVETGRRLWGSSFLWAENSGAGMNPAPKETGGAAVRQRPLFYADPVDPSYFPVSAGATVVGASVDGASVVGASVLAMFA